MCVLHCAQLFVTPSTAARQAPLSIEFSRQEYWSGLPFPSPGGLPSPGIEPGSPVLQVDSSLSEPQGLSGLNTQREIEGLVQSTSAAVAAWLARR